MIGSALSVYKACLGDLSATNMCIAAFSARSSPEACYFSAWFGNPFFCKLKGEMPGKRQRQLLQSSFLFKEKCSAEIADTQVSSKHLHPSSSAPRRVVLGFDIELEHKAFEACESPRSVLDSNAPGSEKQGTGRSLRSGLRALPPRKNGNQGVGLAIAVDIQAEEDESRGLPLVDRCALPPCARIPHCQRSQPITIVASPCARDLPSGKKASRHEDLSPIHSENKAVDSEDSLLGFFVSEEMSPCKDCALHDHEIRESEGDEDNVIQQPIFSVASVPSAYGSLNMESADFLDACAFCERAFLPGKDIYMYRGDQAFCSAECRDKQIKMDESQIEQPAMGLSPKNHVFLGHMHGFSRGLGRM